MRAASVVWVVWVLGGCDLLPASPGVKADPKLFFSIGDPQPNVPVGTFQDALDGWSYLFDISDPSDPLYECQHDDTDMLAKAVQHNFPMEEPCLPEDKPAELDPGAPPFEPTPPPPTPLPQTHTGLPGMNPTPLGYTSWVGAEKGGCGVWSVAMCERRLGITDPSLQVVQGEWETLASYIKMDPTTGTSNAENRAAHFRNYGYCIVDKEFEGTEADYVEAKENVDSCDVKLRFYRRTATGHAFGHVETVIGAGDKSLITNSWGRPAAIEGGSKGGFGHWQDGKRWMEDDGDPTYPPESTDVFITYVCPCTHPMMETLGQKILRTVQGG